MALSDKFLVKRSHELRSNLTDAEKLLWKHLRARRLDGYRFRRQLVIGNYIVDFFCSHKKLVVELDGGQHNLSQNSSYDEKRTQYLNERNLRVLRYWNNEVLTNLEGVLEDIRSNLKKQSSVTDAG